MINHVEQINAAMIGSGPRSTSLERLAAALDRAREEMPPIRVSGQITDISETAFRVSGLSPFLRLGDRVGVDLNGRSELGEVLRINNERATVKLLSSRGDVGLGTRVHLERRPTLAPAIGWKGRTIDALARVMDGGPPLVSGPVMVPLDASPPPPLRRSRVIQPTKTGVRVIDLFTPLCAGQRIGVFAGSGVGKSTLLAMLANAQGFDTVVVALVGERGREVREFVDDTLGDARSRAVIVVSTGDEGPMMRRLCPRTAMSIAEYFRDRGESVLLIVDSITRFAHAAREVSLASGEPAVARGYTPSVFSELPRLLERAGPGIEGHGCITALFSVLVDGDDHNDPVADSIRGTLDGHIVLDRSIADQGRFPAVNILSSISRLAHLVWTPDQRALVTRLKAIIARYEETRDLRMIGGYTQGSDMLLDQAVRIVPRIYESLAQSLNSAPSSDAFLELAATLRAELREGEGRTAIST